MVVVSLRADRAGHAPDGRRHRPGHRSEVPVAGVRSLQAGRHLGGARSGGLGPRPRARQGPGRMHGGSVDADSPGLGSARRSRFTCRIASMTPTPRGAARGGEGQHLPRSTACSVLIVEDDPDAREIAERSITEPAARRSPPATPPRRSRRSPRAPRDSTRSSATSACLGPTATRCSTAVRGLADERGAMPAIAVTAYASAADAQRAMDARLRRPHHQAVYSAVLVAAVRDALDPRALDESRYKKRPRRCRRGPLLTC